MKKILMLLFVLLQVRGVIYAAESDSFDYESSWYVTMSEEQVVPFVGSIVAFDYATNPPSRFARLIHSVEPFSFGGRGPCWYGYIHRGINASGKLFLTLHPLLENDHDGFFKIILAGNFRALDKPLRMRHISESEKNKVSSLLLSRQMTFFSENAAMAKAIRENLKMDRYLLRTALSLRT